MKITTKDNRSSNGIIHVAVVLTHQEDEKEIENTLFQINHNIAICYYYYEDRDYEQIVDDNTITLIMVMISSGLYNDDEYISNIKEFLLNAKKHTKTVLPIREAGLASLFGDRLRGIECLKKDVDETKIQQILDGFLNDKDNLCEDCFDLTIFMSYRKKDHNKMLELIRKIETLPLGKEVSYWYDDFLTPNEDYNEEIRIEIEKADLIVFYITDSIFDEGNYVLREEYPYAEGLHRDNCIYINASSKAEDEIKQIFPTINNNLIEEEEIDNRLMDFTDPFAAKALTPELLFSRGLAYFRGVKVPQNYSYANNRFLSAAALDYAPAMEQIAFMYAKGIYYDIDNSKYLEYSFMAYNEYVSDYENAGNPNIIERILEICRTLCEFFLYVKKDIEVSKKIIIEAMEVLFKKTNYFFDETIIAQLRENDIFKSYFKQLSVIMASSGQILVMEGDYLRAKEQYEYYMQFGNEIGGMCQINNIRLLLRDYKEIIDTMPELINLEKVLCSDNSFTGWRNQGVYYLLMHSIQLHYYGNLKLANDYFEKYCDCAEKVSNSAESSIEIQLYMKQVKDFYIVLYMKKQYKDCIRYLIRIVSSYKILLKLLEERELIVEATIDMCIHISYIGQIHYALKDSVNERTWYLEGLKWEMSVLDEILKTQKKSSIIYDLFQLASNYEESQEIESALHYYKMAVDIGRKKKYLSNEDKHYMMESQKSINILQG